MSFAPETAPASVINLEVGGAEPLGDDDALFRPPRLQVAVRKVEPLGDDDALFRPPRLQVAGCNPA